MKKKILLIQPENAEINRFRRKQFNNFVQITMPYLAAFIDEALYEITLVDEYNEKIPFDRFFDLVAITVNTPNAYHCYKISRIFRERGARVALGGPHVTLMPDEARAYCDHILVGEGEETWPRFLRDFYNGRAGGVYAPVSPPALKDLPPPRWELLRRRFSVMKSAVFSTRGCPYHCRYCNLKQIYGDGFRTRPDDEVLREIGGLKAKHFVFWDDNFFADKRHALALMSGLKKLKKRWAAQVTLADCDDDGLLEAARDAGCLYLFVGLESFSDASLNDAGKGVNRVGDYGRIIGMIHRHRILVQAGVVFGFDSDGPDVFEKTLRACETLGIDGATVSILTPLPKTPVYAQLKAEGRLLTGDWSMYNGKTHVAFQPKNMTARQLYEGYTDFRRRFYSLPSFLKRYRVSKTRLPYSFLMNLGYRLAIRGSAYEEAPAGKSTVPEPRCQQRTQKAER
ncbi:Radical SAM superfamily enzyme YgiQ, UPF0313 family [Sporobacter termitidis DSM 10068]|uniref:Radical SAM superfamily enzyme YgiQ, UPF0313 family n=1 Tax=Sporobacter termitidis DSM 10068 TaxID=1123282 RepID=A0A1M5Z8W4_9FIRM|nr:radical SAM protein [Sporobacter termitidis]SHI20680.1 Radical SAM superfamily enzyme YgiQ, UPF0313 family [Sporobacter termitidis DSM 10068]